jgi:histidinol-phosphate aminotransferase
MSVPTPINASETTRDPLRHVKPAVRALKAYTLAPRPAVVKIDQNENPYELPQALKQRVIDATLARPWGRYPDFDPRELTLALARHSGWRADGILAGNGSNEMIEALLLVTVGPGVRVVIPEPTFTLYALMTTVLGGEAVRVALGPELEYDVAALRRARREAAAALTIVCTPNNPTGGVLDLCAIEELCADGDGLVVIDEAYHEFAGVSAVPLLERYANLIVLRTFSKAMGMAGLRLGYLMAAPDLVREVNKARLPYNVNFFTQAAAMAALREPEVLEAGVARLVRLRDALYGRLAELPGLRVYPSRANFLLIELPRHDPKVVFEALYGRGILVRDVTSYPRLSRCLRVSVGTEEENETLLVALRESLV